jgi:hypothetical protein
MSFELIDAPAEPGGVYPGGGLDFLPASLEAEFERKKHWFDNPAKRRTRFIMPIIREGQSVFAAEWHKTMRDEE